MPRELTDITQKDIDFLKIRDLVREKVKTKKEFKKLVEYLRSYYK